MRNKPTSSKQLGLSWAISSTIMLSTSALLSITGLSEAPVVAHSGFGISAVIYILGLLGMNMLMHLVFHYGGSAWSPFRKGVGIGILSGFMFFMALLFFSKSYDIMNDSMVVLLAGLGGHIAEYTVCGLLIAILHVTRVHRWAVFRTA